MFSRKVLIVFVGLLVFLSSMCGNQKTAVEEPAPKERIETICVLDRLGLRDDAGNWLSSLSLGETVFWLGESKIDSTKNAREYLKVVLSDSTIGWALAWGLVTNARLGAVKKSASIYRRPDPLTVTESKFEMMAMVAIKQTKDNWMEVIGEKRSEKGWNNRSGWISVNDVVIDQSEVTIAILATKALREKDDAVKQEKLMAILKNIPNADSFFMKKLMENLRARENIDVMETME